MVPSHLTPPPPPSKKTEHLEGARAGAARETWVSRLLGTDCYTRAVQDLGAECGRLGNEQRAWLAVSFTTCHQRATRNAPLACRRAAGLRACVEGMDLKTHVDYTTFLTSVHR
jgi:hypothetical protein